jgi:hypothetical protein
MGPIFPILGICGAGFVSHSVGNMMKIWKLPTRQGARFLIESSGSAQIGPRSVETNKMKRGDLSSLENGYTANTVSIHTVHQAPSVSTTPVSPSLTFIRPLSSF